MAQLFVKLLLAVTWLFILLSYGVWQHVTAELTQEAVDLYNQGVSFTRAQWLEKQSKFNCCVLI